MSFHLHLETETVERAHPDKVLAVDPDALVREVLLIMKEHETDSVLVCEDGVVEGIFTERDALRLMAKRSDLGVRIGQVMTKNPRTISDTESVGNAIQVMSKGGYRRLPVVDQRRRPAGVLRVSGILHYLVENFPQFIYNLPPRPHHTTQNREGA